MFRKIDFIITILLIFLLNIFSSYSFAYKVSTHRLITKGAIAKSQKYNSFLTSFEFDKSNADRNIEDGSELEDDEATKRYLNHFYDPINSTGLNRLGTTAGRLSKEWGYDGGGGFTLGPWNNSYSWIKARQYIYDILTKSTVAERENNFNLLFRSLGHIVHLVQDLAQPSHVRNDGHSNTYESKFWNFFLNTSTLEDWAHANPSTIINLTGLAGSAVFQNSYDDFFDMFALYSNTTFFSDDTIFTNYASPSKTDTNYDRDLISFSSRMLADVVAEDGTIDRVPFVYRTTAPAIGTKLAQIGYFGKEAIGKTTIEQATFHMSDIVVYENAYQLIPKAVEYSAGLLDYFFRGEIEVNSTSGKIFTITNTSSENLNGTFELYYDSTDGNRKRLQQNYTLALTAGQESSQLTLSPPQDAETINEYILVFKGTLGNEPDAVIGKKIKLNPVNIQLSFSNDPQYYTKVWNTLDTNFELVVDSLLIGGGLRIQGLGKTIVKVKAVDLNDQPVENITLSIVIDPAVNQIGTGTVPATIELDANGEGEFEFIPGEEITGYDSGVEYLKTNIVVYDVSPDEANKGNIIVKYRSPISFSTKPGYEAVLWTSILEYECSPYYNDCDFWPISDAGVPFDLNWADSSDVDVFPNTDTPLQTDPAEGDFFEIILFDYALAAFADGSTVVVDVGWCCLMVWDDEDGHHQGYYYGYYRD